MAKQESVGSTNSDPSTFTIDLIIYPVDKKTPPKDIQRALQKFNIGGGNM